MCNDELKIRQLIERYMDGKTTLEEEDFLMDCFGAHPDVSDDLKDYQMMFILLGSERLKGMQCEIPVWDRRKKLRLLWMGLSVAASLALAFLVFHPSEDGTQMQPVASIVSKPSVSHLEKEAESQVTSSKTIEKDSAKVETETTPSVPSAPKKTSKKRIYHKHLFDVAPPTVDIAMTTDQALEHTEQLTQQGMELPDMAKITEEILQQAEFLTETVTKEALQNLASLQDEEE